mmetsp:Transcript_2667/g.8815  ORF Transcript_2667/g.8815 Transcript_2667/m.8815 type:complete len:287 (+) Transcript_2667:2258-3118(+)
MSALYAGAPAPHSLTPSSCINILYATSNSLHFTHAPMTAPIVIFRPFGVDGIDDISNSSNTSSKRRASPSSLILDVSRLPPNGTNFDLDPSRAGAPLRVDGFTALNARLSSAIGTADADADARQPSSLSFSSSASTLSVESKSNVPPTVLKCLHDDRSSLFLATPLVPSRGRLLLLRPRSFMLSHAPSDAKEASSSSSSSSSNVGSLARAPPRPAARARTPRDRPRPIGANPSHGPLARALIPNDAPRDAYDASAVDVASPSHRAARDIPSHLACPAPLARARPAR